MHRPVPIRSLGRYCSHRKWLTGLRSVEKARDLFGHDLFVGALDRRFPREIDHCRERWRLTRDDGEDANCKVVHIAPKPEFMTGVGHDE